jgi:hypothetical protein
LRFVIGLALNAPLNDVCINKIKFIIRILTNYSKYTVCIIAPNNFSEIIIPDVQYQFSTYYDDDSLFDFSRYNRILCSSELQDDDILLAFNDTLGNGRKFNLGLFLYFVIVLFILLNDRKKNFNMFAPIDSDTKESWMCPYFFIGRVSFLRTLNFIDYLTAYTLISKSVRRNLTLWIKIGWRQAQIASKKQKNIKFKTLILERALLKADRKNKLVFMFSRSNLFRIINSLYS